MPRDDDTTHTHNEELWDWRKRVMNSLDELRKDVTAIKLSTATTEAIRELELRTRSLEEFKGKTLAIWSTINTVIFILWTLALRFILK